MSKERATAVKKGADSAGVKFAIVHFVNVFGNDCGYEVWKFATNYREGSRWVTCKRGMSLNDAEAYFESRVGCPACGVTHTGMCS